MDQKFLAQKRHMSNVCIFGREPLCAPPPHTIYISIQLRQEIESNSSPNHVEKRDRYELQSILDGQWEGIIPAFFNAPRL